MAYGEIIPPTPVRKMRLAPKAPLKTPKKTDRFTECKYISTFAHVFIKTVIHVFVRLLSSCVRFVDNLDHAMNE
jgi:hypothetical protein